MKETTAYMMTDMMKTVLQSELVPRNSRSSSAGAKLVLPTMQMMSWEKLTNLTTVLALSHQTSFTEVGYTPYIFWRLFGPLIKLPHSCFR